MNEFDEVLDLRPPHGFLMAQEKQTAIARVEPLDTEKSYLIVSNGEAFGVATLEQPAQIKIKDFDGDEWANQHRITQRERRQWWPDSEAFYVYRLKSWQPFEGVKLYEGGKVIDEPRLTAEQWEIVSRAKELPKQIIIEDDFISLNCNHTAYCGDESFYNREVKPIMDATFNKQINIDHPALDDEIIPIYSLALVRNPRMRVAKKNLKIETKQEDGEAMPYRIRERDGEFCVIKINPDDSDGEVEKCHPDMEMARSHLAALNINVVAEEKSVYDEPKDKPNFMKRLKLAAKNLLDIVTLAEKEAEPNLLDSNYGIAQKEVNGEPWHFTWSTNAFEDREGEIFSTKSLEKYVTEAERKADRGYFNLWHINAEDGHFNSDFARKEWQGVVGRFLVEAGPYLDNEKGQAAKEFFSEFGEGHPEIAPEGWGCSPEYKYLPEERITGVYENIWITRTSTLPKMAAANIWTETRQLARSKNMALTEDQTKAAVALFGKEYVDNLMAEGEKRTEELEAANVAHKNKSEDIEQPPVQVELNMEDLATEVSKQFSADLAPIAEAIGTMASGMKEIEERLEKLEKEQNIKAKTESPRYVFEWKRASEANETTVTEVDELKDKRPAETKSAAGNDPWKQVFG